MTEPNAPEDFTIHLVQGNIKAAMKAAEAPSRDLWQVDLDRIKVIPGYNVRVRNEAYEKRVRWIADSIKANGFKQDKPLSGFVAADGNELVINLVGGHRRLEAAKLARSEGVEIARLPIVIKPSGTSVEDLTVDLMVDNESDPLTPYEVAILVKRMHSYGVEEPEIARRFGVSETWVRDLLFLMSLPRELRTMVSEGKISAVNAIKEYQSKGERAIESITKAVEKAAESGKTKVSQKDLDPAAKLTKAVKKQAVPLYKVVSEIYNSDLGKVLPDDLKKRIQEIIDKLPNGVSDEHLAATE